MSTFIYLIMSNTFLFKKKSFEITINIVIQSI